MSKRPRIPAEIKRKILVESGHRCAIPHCRSLGGVDVHHIVPWRNNNEHDPKNLIALCPNCHRLAEEKKIDRKSLHKYKEISRMLINPLYPHKDNEIKAFIKFNPNTVKDIFDSKNISSLCDNGILDFSFYFDEYFNDPFYVVQALGNGHVDFTVISQDVTSIRLLFSEPCPNIVRLEFKY